MACNHTSNVFAILGGIENAVEFANRAVTCTDISGHFRIRVAARIIWRSWSFQGADLRKQTVYWTKCLSVWVSRPSNVDFQIKGANGNGTLLSRDSFTRLHTPVDNSSSRWDGRSRLHAMGKEVLSNEASNTVV